ncbi:hydrogenase expression/formation protein HypE [Mesosutterella sp. OilRF-GAM-744-9]|uniref:Hydrogenase expression/formation protein HypE n=1 Tax=Mesosutterella porci TaxID=2915351 RepID=A0ABS9MS01_9BURK|nr:hydrogenase expression/formation protein HypE [Mesosutterella sp. oilRF-744-WT-GAM-9]MCG5031411.1 hydrogenase expression/formation protein HypE [Mesosutterella sp. oilRF-744-WT-GAM-9]
MAEEKRRYFATPIDVKHGIIDLTHGAGGRATAQLISQVFARAFSNEILEEGHDGAFLPEIHGTPVVSCDAHVIRPLFFPGGDIGSLAVAGTVNDVAMCGAKPLYIAACFVIEEGFPIADLDRIVQSMGRTAREAGVKIVTGDTKVVEKGHGDGLYITTTGIGEVLPGIRVSGRLARPGDRVIISGSMGDHGMAIMSEREGLSFGSGIQSDSAPLNALVEEICRAAPHVHVLRDPTRGGLATTLNEIASQSCVGIMLDEASIPVHEDVAQACEFLGLDPLYVANEGKLIAIVPEEEAAACLKAMRAAPHGEESAIVGTVTAEDPGYVQMTTLMGGVRMVDWLNADQLPRIC